MVHANTTDSGAQKTRILLVDDHEVVRYGIAKLINEQPDLVVSAEAEDAATAFSLVAEIEPDLAIVDISLKKSNGLELIKNIRARYPEVSVLVISMHEEAIYAEVALRAGAMGYIMKDEALGEVLKGIRKVLSGRLYVSDRLAGEMLTYRMRPDVLSPSSPFQRLTSREIEVLHLLGQWKRTREIAKELHISVKTVEFYRQKLKEKLNLKNATELIQYAVQWARNGTAAAGGGVEEWENRPLTTA